LRRPVALPCRLAVRAISSITAAKANSRVGPVPASCRRGDIASVGRA
jgi:hypothetical protein